MNPEQAKAAADMMLSIWEGEVRGTAQVLAAIGKGNRDYKPDPKSRTAWEIATHIATADMFFLDGVINGKLEYDAEGDKRAQAQFKNAADLESFYTKSFPERAKAVRALSGDALAQPMSFFGMWEWPRARFIGWANNHSIHHRGQLAAYLRPMGSRVPDIYGPSADSEKKAAAAT
jgi:uncharacterized damage-inducible protein DinB